MYRSNLWSASGDSRVMSCSSQTDSESKSPLLEAFRARSVRIPPGVPPISPKPSSLSCTSWKQKSGVNAFAAPQTEPPSENSE